jgi:hypothetical protein
MYTLFSLNPYFLHRLSLNHRSGELRTYFKEIYIIELETR